jgi:peptidoglycan-associated lipoprotein
MKDWLAILPLAVLLGANGCAKKSKPDQDLPISAPINASAEDARPHDSDNQNALGLVTIHFAYDSSNLDAAAKAALKRNVKILKNHIETHLQIEGHCDERGGEQYNLALGERRAHMVEKYLSVSGISPSRITVISMGKEKPLDTAETEEAYAKNRRANFVITE